MEPSEVRRRLRAVMDDAKRKAAARRTQVDAAVRSYEQFLEQVAVPAFRQVAQALTAEGRRFKVFTPGQDVRLASEFSADDFVELGLESDRNPPAVVLRSSRGRGRRNVSSERVVFEDRPIDQVTDEDVVTTLLQELPPFLER
jgi:hypothetical protein